jgi:hypothetical protein
MITLDVRSLKITGLRLLARAGDYCCNRRWSRFSTAIYTLVYRLSGDRAVFHVDDYGCPNWPVCDFCGHYCDCMECEIGEGTR